MLYFVFSKRIPKMLLVWFVRWATGQGDIWSHTSGSIHTTSLQLWRLISWDPYTAMGERRHLCQITPESLESGLDFYPQKKAVKETNLCQEWGQKVIMTGAWLKPTSFSCPPWVLLWVGWGALAVLSHLGKCLSALEVWGHCMTAGLRGQGVLLKASLTTVGPSSHMRPEIKFSCQHPGHSYLYRNRITSQNLP